MTPEGMAPLVPVIAAALGGAAVGFERQWAGHATGPRARFAGVRTFTLLGGAAGLAGWMSRESPEVGAVLLAGLVALVVAAYVRASVQDIDGTTETAALVVCAAGALAGRGEIGLASGVIAVTTLLLAEKSRLHALVSRVDEPGLRAGLRFAVMAIVVLPLLPEGAIDPWGRVRLRELWALVLFFSGLSFAGYLARRAAGPRQGYPLAGLLGGLISSTNVTLTFARASRKPDAPRAALASGVLAACTILFLRVLAACAVLNPSLAWALVPLFAPGLLVGAVAVVAAMRGALGEPGEDLGDANPLEFWSALQMAVLFQVVLLIVGYVDQAFGRAGLLVSGAVLGLTDLDALTVSMARAAAGGVAVPTAAQAVAIGIISNTALKAALAAFIGDGRFRMLTLAGLLAIGAAVAATLVVTR
jgi:uncharacterized membrane protein (DUF4010 family)